MVFLVQKLLGHFMKTEVYCTVNGKDSPRLHIHYSAMWKAVVKVGGGSEAAMSQWEPSRKKAFPLGSLNFYLKPSEHLSSRLPFENGFAEHFWGQEGGVITSWNDVLAVALDDIAKQNISHDGWVQFFIEGASRVYEYWQVIFDLMKSDSLLKYPLLNKVANARNIKHGDKELDKASVVCEKHFTSCTSQNRVSRLWYDVN